MMPGAADAGAVNRAGAGALLVANGLDYGSIRTSLLDGNPMKTLILSTFVLILGAAAPAQASDALAKKYLCTTCHVVKGAKTIGPSYADVAKKYAGQADAAAKLADKVKKGGQGVWGQVPMPPNPNVPDADMKALISWILATK
jgi:cytochrome c